MVLLSCYLPQQDHFGHIKELLIFLYSCYLAEFVKSELLLVKLLGVSTRES